LASVDTVDRPRYCGVCSFSLKIYYGSKNWRECDTYVSQCCCDFVNVFIRLLLRGNVFVFLLCSTSRTLNSTPVRC